MELGAISSATAYFQTQEVSPRKEAGKDARRDAAVTAANTPVVAQEQKAVARDPRQVDNAKETADRKDPASQASQNSGIQFEYQDQRQVMKVYNSKGILIYQVPSEGRLTVIEAADTSAQPSIQLTA
jgi:hypothetical protein